MTTWVVRVHERCDDSTRIRSQCREAVKEYNGGGEVHAEPQNWERRVGIWVD